MKLLIILTLVAFSSWVEAQNNYRVLKTEGCIGIQKAENCLTKNSQIGAKDSICFHQIKDFAVLMDDKGGWFTLKLLDTTGFLPEKISWKKVSEIISPNVVDTNKLATRGTASIGVSIKELFGRKRFTVIGDEARLNVNSREFALSKDKFFVFEYTLDTFKIAKRLGFREQVVRIQKNNLTELNGSNFNQSKIENVHLYYYEPQSKNAELITNFDLLFVTTENLYAEFDEVYNYLPEKNNQKTYSALEHFFNTCYGITEPKMLKNTIENYIEKKSNQ
jgi:hypothetical protein